jgi:cbb3-type cytochrome oxidase maturation protein
VAGQAVTVLLFFIPLALGLGALALLAFFWSIRSGQFDDPDGDAVRILLDDEDPPPAQPPA